MPHTHGIFWQQQSGGLCRMHSLNAYFGKEVISPQDFNQYQADYDAEYKSRFNLENKCANFDLVMSDQNNIVSYILKQFKVYTRYYALNQTMLSKTKVGEILQDLEGDFFFIYNENHIYGARKKDNKWYSVNSMGGVRIMNVNSIFKTKNLGFIIPVNIQKEFYRNLQLIKEVLNYNDDAQDLSNIINEFLESQNKSKNILGDLEIPLGLCMDIMETNMIHKNSDKFSPIEEIVRDYNEFLKEFTNGRYNDIELILQYLPNILFQLCKLSSDIKK